jgi:protein-S-isoprenylcysteine O-methyltransferase Ste14
MSSDKYRRPKGINKGRLVATLLAVPVYFALNKFFEPTVRIQTERDHAVIDTGPYACVRHPGYLGWVLLTLSLPLCLGSLWALLPAGLSSLLVLLRASWEDQTLQVELTGYKEYVKQVRYKLVPGAW